MALINSFIVVKWNGSTRKWYEEKGYTWTGQNTSFNCEVKDVQPSSTARVKILCDYCDSIFEKEFRYVNKNKEIIDKDCCKMCKNKKQEEVMLSLYGVKSSMYLDTAKEKLRKQLQTDFTIVYEMFSKKGLKLLSTEKDYKNDRSRLFFICSKHDGEGVQETNFANVKSMKGCCGYGKYELTANAKRLDGSTVFNDFINFGLTPKFNPSEYLNNSIPLPFICPNHQDKGIQFRRYAGLKYANGCVYCAKTRTAEKLRLDKELVFNELMAKGLIPLPDEQYITKDTPIKYRCTNHFNHIQYTSYGNFKATKQCCCFCRIEESLSSLNRRLRSCTDEWKKESKTSCNYKCVLTGNKKYEVHHLHPFNEIIKESLDELNIELKSKYTGEELLRIKEKVVEIHKKYPLGICISKTLHTLLHSIYTKNSKIEDYYEFETRLKSGEFNAFLEENNLKLII